MRARSCPTRRGGATRCPPTTSSRPNREGITLVNIGVGPSNAKTICDHLAVLRPHAWMMIGHCGGLRPSQKIGDYVLAHAYLRDDHVLDPVLPPEIPCPRSPKCSRRWPVRRSRSPGEHGADLKKRMRTGTVVTTDDRNWELRFTQSAKRMSLSRAVGVDMESATIAGQGYRFRVPLRHAAVRVGQAAARRDQAAGPGQCLLRGSDCRAPPDRGDRLQAPQGEFR